MNIYEFDNYKIRCPFCSSELKLKAISGSGVTSIAIYKYSNNDYVLFYDKTDRFSTVIRTFISKIILHKDTSVTFEDNPECLLGNQDNMVNSALQGNKVFIYKSCEICTKSYKIFLDPIDLTNNSIKNYRTHLFCESFFYDLKPEKYLKIKQLHYTQETSIDFFCMGPKGNMILNDTLNLPWVNFDFSDPIKLEKKIKMILTFS